MKRLIKYIILFVFVCVGNVTWAEEGERESSLFPDSSYVLRGPKADFLEKDVYKRQPVYRTSGWNLLLPVCEGIRLCCLPLLPTR